LYRRPDDSFSDATQDEEEGDDARLLARRSSARARSLTLGPRFPGCTGGLYTLGTSAPSISALARQVVGLLGREQVADQLELREHLGVVLRRLRQLRRVPRVPRRRRLGQALAKLIRGRARLERRAHLPLHPVSH
jgi:hypothetical protein